MVGPARGKVQTLTLTGESEISGFAGLWKTKARGYAGGIMGQEERRMDCEKHHMHWKLISNFPQDAGG